MNRLAFAAALAVLSSGASAQSTVTLFGLVDLNVTHYSAGGKSGATGTTVMNDGTVNGMNGSRWGVRTSEDLGSGLTAGAWLEGGILVDTGASAQGGRGFGRQAFISLAKKDLGELRMGRQYVLSDSLVGQGNPYGNAMAFNPTTSVTNAGRNLPLFLNAPRADNVVQVQSGAFGPATIAAQWAPGEGVNDRFYGVRAAYAPGPMYVGVSYEWNKARIGGDDTNKSLSVSANYNFGGFKLLGGLQRNSDLRTGSGNGAAVGVSSLVVTGAKTFAIDTINGWTLGAEVPVGALTLAANYTRMTYEGPSGGSDNLGKIAVGGWYALSKRTLVYTSAYVATGGLKDYIAQKSVLQAGLRTSF